MGSVRRSLSSKQRNKRFNSSVLGRRSRSVPLPIRPSRFSATRARSTGSGEMSRPRKAAAWVMIILITPMSIPSVTGPSGAQIGPLDRFARRASPNSARIKAQVDQPRTGRGGRPAPSRDRACASSALLPCSAGAVSLPRTYRLYGGLRGRQRFEGGRRTCL